MYVNLILISLLYCVVYQNSDDTKHMIKFRDKFNLIILNTDFEKK